MYVTEMAILPRSFGQRIPSIGLASQRRIGALCPRSPRGAPAGLRQLMGNELHGMGGLGSMALTAHRLAQTVQCGQCFSCTMHFPVCVKWQEQAPMEPLLNVGDGDECDENTGRHQ
jgi:hypothetical protein